MHKKCSLCVAKNKASVVISSSVPQESPSSECVVWVTSYCFSLRCTEKSKRKKWRWKWRLTQGWKGTVAGWRTRDQAGWLSSTTDCCQHRLLPFYPPQCRRHHVERCLYTMNHTCLYSETYFHTGQKMKDFFNDSIEELMSIGACATILLLNNWHHVDARGECSACVSARQPSSVV